MLFYCVVIEILTYRASWKETNFFFSKSHHITTMSRQPDLQWYSAIPVAVSLFKNYKNILCFILFCPFSPPVIFIFLLCPALCFSVLLSDLSLVTIFHYSFIIMHCMSLATNYFNASSSLPSTFCPMNT